MTESELDKYRQFFSPMIKELLKDNSKFYRFNEPIKYSFFYNEDARIFATCDRNKNTVNVNINSLIIAYEEKDFLTIEYYLLHEVRHIFQHLIISDYLNNIEICIEKGIVKKWIKEENNYIKSCDDDGNENEEYFKQDIEMDAYAFAYAVIKYKYNKVDTLYVPKIYGDDFRVLVNDWIDRFKEEKL